MLKSVPNLHPCSSPSLRLESRGVHRPRSSFTVCCGLRDYSGIPYLGTFSKPRDTFDDHFEVRNLPVIENGPIQLSGDDKSIQSSSTASKEENQKPVKKMTVAEKLMEERDCPVPDGIPPTWEELEEIERMKMRDSSFTRLLRYIGGYPSWYVPRPDHETD